MMQQLKRRLKGELDAGEMVRILYSTDASEYKELPLAVAFPKCEEDVRELVLFCRQNRLGLIPRTAGTSLAGQVVGSGIVMDMGRHMDRVIAVDAGNRRVRVQPGVIRNELNRALAPHRLFFAPETSTANRAMIGGMVGNNSCGANSVVYGAVRDHLVSARGFLSDGSEVTFGPLSEEEFRAKCEGADSLERACYRKLRDILGDPANRRLIEEGFPKKSVVRRNTGYALDMLMDCGVFGGSPGKPFNLCQMIAGSEGTLFVGVEFELDCDPVPPAPSLMCAHFTTLDESLRANLVALRHGPSAVELIDRHVLDCTKVNLTQRHNRFFVQGDPGAILVIEIRRESPAETAEIMRRLEAEFRAAGLGYAFPVLLGGDVERVWELRRAGQGVMTNVVGDTRPVELVEDTAVAVEDLPAYIGEFQELMRGKYGLSCVYYAHAGAGELHTRPLLNLKSEEGHRMFRQIAVDIAALVKKYRGSLSGEHGDGRLRGEFIPFMVGEDCFRLMRAVKSVFDPEGILNPSKIIDTPPMDAMHRNSPDHATPEYETFFDFSDSEGVVRAAEKCSGSGDCRKPPLAGGTMCPSFRATREEKDSTRGRANLLAHMLNHPPDPKRPFVDRALYEVMDLCLSCKACKSECPASVDMARLKAEFLQHYYDAKGVPLRSRMVALFPLFCRWLTPFACLWNRFFATAFLRKCLNRLAGFHPDRSIPPLSPVTLRSWMRSRTTPPHLSSAPLVYLFCDEFTDTQDAEMGREAVELLEGLGYRVVIPPHGESGRASLSKGLLRRARGLIRENVRRLAPLVKEETPLIGLEPSAILTFRDEAPDLLRGADQAAARQMAEHCLLLDEFLAREAGAGRITAEAFTDEALEIRVHGHCFQKSLASLEPTKKMLSLPKNYRVTIIPSGCCGMAGAFGYEREHYDISMAIGEMVLFPDVRKQPESTVVAAAGTSCRHQIHDGTGKKALHPAQILRRALRAVR